MKVDRIETGVWHAVLYFWLYRLWRTFVSSRTYIQVPSRSNICEYGRTLLFGIVAGVCYVGFMGWLVFCTVFYPSQSFGFGYWMVVGCVVLALVLIVCAIGLAAAGKDKLGDWWNKKSSDLADKMEGTENRPSIFAIIREYIRAKNEQVCTQIEFVAPVKTSHGDSTVKVSGFEVQQAVERHKQAVAHAIDVPMIPVSSEATSAPQSPIVVLSPPLERVRSISTKRIPFLPVWWSASIFSVMLLIIFGVFAAINESNTQLQAVWEGECSVASWKPSGKQIGMVVDCRGKRATIYNSEAILGHLNSKAPLTCFESVEGGLYCAKEDQKRKKVT